MKEKILQTIKNLRINSEKRNFVQSIDLIISLKDLDLKKPENRFSEDVVLPNGRGKNATVVVFSDTLKDLDCEILTSSDIQRMATNKRELRNIASNTDFFLSESQLMPLIGKLLGQILSPRGKMPKIITGDIKKLVGNYEKSVRVMVKSSSVIQCFVGKEDMDDDKIADNVEVILKLLETKLPRGRQNIGKLLLKFTMSKPVKIEVK